MGVLRFIRQWVLAFDRIGSRIPQLIQIWPLELFFALPLAFFIGKAIDIHGILVDLDSGGQALLLEESLSVADFRDVMQHSGNGELRATGTVIEEITDDQRTYYGFDPDAFGAPPPAGRVMVLLSYP